MDKTERIMLFMPTIDEAGTVESLIGEIHKHSDLDILIIDDGSTDGTVEILKRLVQDNKRLMVVFRDRKCGIGNAHKMALKFAKEENCDFLITMDADGSHDPIYVPKLIANKHQADITVGSRFLQPESIKNWSMIRKTMTFSVHFITVVVLGLKEDTSSAFRIYNLDCISDQFLNELQSESYDFFFESVFRAKMQGKRLAQIPITLPPRTYGHSKMKWPDIKIAMRRLFALLRIRLSILTISRKDQVHEFE